MSGSDSQQQATMPTPQPTQQHHWLQKLVGEWIYEGEAECPGADGPAKFTGAEVVRPVGDFWVVGDGEGETPDGQRARMMITIGFDPERGRFVGSFVASMMPHLWVYDGELDASGRVLTLHSDGPGFDAEGKPTGKPAKFKDVVEIKSDDRRVFSGHILKDDGTWEQMMSAEYRRK